MMYQKMKNSVLPPPLYKCIVVLLAAAAFILTSCSGLHEDLGEKSIRINLPPIVSASGNSRSISDDRIPTLKGEVRRYRVTVNDMTREGTGSSYDFRLPVGMRATVTVECLNDQGEVIIRAVKDFTVMAGDNNVNINLKTDGEEIIPASAAGRVTYDWGEASRHGNKNGLPSDPTTYKEGDLFTVGDGSGMTWEHAAQQSGFSGWRASPAIEPENGGQATDAPTPGQKYKMPKGGVTLTAQWQKKTYTISYDMNASGSGGTQTSTNIGDDTGNEALGPAQVSATKPDAVSIVASGKNFTFTHWLGSDGNTYQPGQNIPSITGNLTLTAQWSDKDVWTVTYIKGSTSATEQDITNWKGSDNVVDGESITLPTLSTTGYTFNGWQITGEPVNKTGSYRPTGNVDATAQWTANSYAVTVSPGNSVQASEVQNLPSLGQQNYNATVQLGNEPTRTGYTFAGWDVTPTSVQINGSGNSRSFTMPAQAVTLTAQWTANSYAVTVSPGNSVQANEVQNLPSLGQQNYNATVQLGNEPTRTGYTFAGWDVTPTSVQINGNGNSRNFIMPAQAVTLTAQWTPIPYTITYNANGGGNNPSNTTFNIETANVSFALSASLLKQGYSFANWETTVGQDVSIKTTPAELIPLITSGTTLALRAKWQEMTELNISTTGDDTTGDGSTAKPFATVKKAFEVIGSLSNANMTVKALSDITASETATFTLSGKTVTLSSDSTKRTISAGSKTLIEVAGGTLKLENIVISGPGKDTGLSTESLVKLTGANAILEINSGSELTGFSATASSNIACLYVQSGTVKMTDDSKIYDNSSQNSCAGVYVASGTFTMTGGSIINNTSSNYSPAGVYIETNSTFNLGDPDNSSAVMSQIQITNNTGPNSSASNLKLSDTNGPSTNFINIYRVLTADSSIGISCSAGVFTRGWSTSGNTTGFFTSDLPDQSPTLPPGQIELLMIPN